MIISIVTPCRNAAHYLAETIASLREQSAVRSGLVDLQHIVVDGASTDGTIELVEHIPDTELISEPDRGMYDALAKGLARARGEVIGYLNAGDILHPCAFDVLAEVFKQPDVDWVTGYSTQINECLQITAVSRPTRYRREFVLNGFYADDSYPFCIQQESTFWSRCLNSSIDLNRLRSFRLAGDYFLWTQFAKNTELHSVNSMLGAFRVHRGQLSEQMADYRKEVQKSIRPATRIEQFTAWWETRCNCAFKSVLWKFTMRKPPARIFDFHHVLQRWEPR